jgi:D-alanine-D-alanine ligase
VIGNRSQTFNFRSVVLVADVMRDDASSITALRRDLEQTDQETFNALTTAIESLGLSVTHYEGPDALAENAQRHRDDIVLSIFGGRASRNRMALTPAVCETFGLRFIGPDAYGRITAQDKETSKRLALDCGLRTPAWRVLRTPADLERLGSQTYPSVVKPLLEGSSIGIGPDSVAHNESQARKVAQRLMRDFGQPVLVESFVAGREVAFVAIENGAELDWAYTEVFIEGEPDFFESRLFDAEEKMHRRAGRSVRVIDGELALDDLAAIQILLKVCGGFGYTRVDGRHANGQFNFIELTPDAWIDPRGQFAMGFTEKGWSYAEVIAAVLASAG